MACYKPIPAWLPPGAPRGVQPTLHPPLGTGTLALPCGRCIGCRTEYAAQWAERCQHEASQYPHNVSITLTYDDSNVPEGGWLDAAELTRFFKRLRKRATTGDGTLTVDSGSNCRYFACGEYGEKTGRPHYHALIFGLDFPDKTFAGYSKRGEKLYESATLRELWPHGFNRIGNASVRTAAYIAQYSLKKQGTWKGGVRINGTVRPPPFLRMSRKPAIGVPWLAQYHDDLTHGYLVAGGRRRAIPRMYMRQLETWERKQLGPAKPTSLWEEITIRKLKHYHATFNPENNTPERREAAETIRKRMKELTGTRGL